MHLIARHQRVTVVLDVVVAASDKGATFRRRVPEVGGVARPCVPRAEWSRAPSCLVPGGGVLSRTAPRSPGAGLDVRLVARHQMVTVLLDVVVAASDKGATFRR
ncbi:hypothetical protein [Mycetocola spongiae]|uniref:hypothetical protein n=1 Tax=Mycetocola spongiae TaxID=2859226 RepID=UPI001CF5631B|nr:hypothetical protein [Mycetocola spongiae]UCR88177.1 hypothetical protein KXZ72_09265 [Mycetocola spongiae]